MKRTVSGFQQTQQYICFHFYLHDMFRPIDRISGRLYKISLLIALHALYSKFCKDGLMMVNWSKHVVEVKLKHIYIYIYIYI